MIELNHFVSATRSESTCWSSNS